MEFPLSLLCSLCKYHTLAISSTREDLNFFCLKNKLIVAFFSAARGDSDICSPNSSVDMFGDFLESSFDNGKVTPKFNL